VVPAAVLAAFELVELADDRRARLGEHVRTLRRGLREMGYEVLAGDSHIIPVLLGDASLATRLSAALLERGVFVHGIRPPTVPAGTSRLRISPMATHAPAQIDHALEQLRALRG
jgi:7-keto-8-aminopelargonate synthetase-like enzyme